MPCVLPSAENQANKEDYGQAPSDTELNEVLRAATVPARSKDYWKQFPKRVAAAIRKSCEDSDGGNARNH